MSEPQHTQECSSENVIPATSVQERASLAKLGIGIAALLIAAALLASGYLRKSAPIPTPSHPSPLQQLEKAAADGDTSAMNVLGLMYYDGHEVTADESQARQWFEKAAASGDTSAMNNLGLIYEHPRTAGVSPDYRQARLWFEKAVAAGDPAAMFHLGVMYEESEGLARNYQTARKLYEKAAAAGNTDARERLRQLP